MTIDIIRNYRDQRIDVAACDGCGSKWAIEGNDPVACETCIGKALAVDDEIAKQGGLAT